MSAPTLCSCTLNVKTFLAGTTFTTAELVCTPRKSFIENGNLVPAAPSRVMADLNGLCTLSLVETASSNQKVVFTLNWRTGPEQNFGSVVFDPVLIPNQASVDLSTLLTISQG